MACCVSIFAVILMVYLVDRFPWLLPLMEPEDVADEIVNAVLINQEMLCLPRIVNVLATMKR